MVHASVNLGNLYLNKRHRDVSPVFFPKYFSFSYSSMIHFKLIFFFCQKSPAHMCESTSELSLQPD